MELATLGALLRMVSYVVVNRLATEGMARIGGFDGIIISVSQGVIRQWFAMGIFHVLRSMYFNAIFALLVIAWVVEVGWDATGVEWFPFDYKRTKIFFFFSYSRVDA